jgi:hypothetical protein
MRDGHALGAAVLGNDVDDGEVSQSRDQQPRDLPERLAAVEWRGQDAKQLIEQHGMTCA